MTILHGFKNDFSGFFDCQFLDGGAGRFKFVGYLYESFVAHMQFLGKIPIKLNDIFFFVLSLSSLLISFIAYKNTKSFILALFVVTIFLVSYPVLMVFEFHYRGPKVISILITAIFFLLIDSNIHKN